MTDRELLIKVMRNYFATRRNKRYGRDQMDFEARWTASLVRFCRSLSERDYRITGNYAFLTSTPRWREIFATSFDGRMADHLLCDALKPYFERVLSPRTFNNREGKGAQAAINQVIEDIVRSPRATPVLPASSRLT